MLIKVFLVGALFCLFLSSCNQKTDSFLAQATNETPNQINTKEALPISTPQPTETPKQEYDSSELDELEKDTFPYGKRTSVPKNLLKQMLRQSKDLRQCLREGYENDLAEFSEPIVSETPDLNQDGSKDFIVSVENRCSGHNSPTYVYQSVGSSYKLLLDTTSNGIHVKKSKSNGFYDLSVSAHSSCCSGAIDIYKFIRGKYRVSKCFVWNTIKTEEGKDKAQIKPQKCGEPT